ncbi:MAG: hypothetical protein ACKOB0_15660, partial [Chthoniobacterales bacterium]
MLFRLNTEPLKTENFPERCQPPTADDLRSSAQFPLSAWLVSSFPSGMSTKCRNKVIFLTCLFAFVGIGVALYRSWSDRK